MLDLYLVLRIRKIHNRKEKHESFQVNVYFIHHINICLLLENNSKYMYVAGNLIYVLVYIGICSSRILPALPHPMGASPQASSHSAGV